MSFVLFARTSEFSTLIGHLYKALGFWMVYRAIVTDSIRRADLVSVPSAAIPRLARPLLGWFSSTPVPTRSSLCSILANPSDWPH